MKKHYAVMLCGALLGTTGASLTALAQQAAPAAKVYRATPTKINNLVHTKLDVRFDYKKCYLYGKAWLTLKPHTYATDSLRLDAKGMDIKNVSIVKSGKNVALKYKYEDSVSLNISLDRTYKGEEAYTVYIDYTAKPNELKVQGSSAITDAKGLYFINPDGKDKNKPIQVWTQGETEASSVWFPTIDRPNQKTTQELIMTVPAKYVSLSNGKLVSQKANADGTRTDTWKMDQPHSPYLFMMAVGDFKIYKDKWRGKEVNYYLEPKYAPYAKEIFGMTPEAMEFYSKTLGVDYPWVKYAQIVVRDYVSGAMENTSATLHGSHIQATAHELVDAYYSGAESTIVHELFHQWFGDYVTAESWSNLTVNESFADFGETLWGEYKYGQDEGDAHSYDDMQNYLRGAGNAKKDLVRFYYDDKEDMFDAVTYKKGGTILNMLRNYLGREAFYKGLKIYLSINAYKNGEAHQLRLALEEASGKDLNWFFNQWYFGAGHPVLDITYKWDAATKTQTVFLKQTQTGQIFSLPMAIDIYQGGKKVRHQYWMTSATDSVSFKLAGKPDLVNVDGDKKTTALKKDAKTIEEFAFQYANAPLYLDRYEAITAAVPLQKTDAAARKILIAALKDKYYGLRVRAIRALDLTNDDVRNAAQPLLVNIAQTDKNYQVQAAALSMLGTLKASGNLNLFKQAVKSPAYSVQAAALNGIAALDKAEALNIAKTLDKDSGAGLAAAIVNLYIETGDEAYWPYIHAKYSEFGIQTQFQLLRKYAAMAGNVKNSAYAQQGIAQLKQIGIQYKSSGVVPAVTGMLNTIKTQRTAMGDSASAQAVDAALAEINAK